MTTSVYFPSKVTGSWFPTGYYGHYRNQARNDIYTEFRKLARPQPPRAFITRIQDDPVRHTFSNHDNRFSFITDATYLDLGVGKKRKAPDAPSNKVNKDLMTWENNHLTAPVVSSYRYAFSDGKPESQIIATRPKTSFETDSQIRQTTSYRYAYGPGVYNPNKDFLESTSREATLARPRTSKPKKISASGRLSVADCMVWRPYQSAQGAHVHSSEPPLGRSSSRFGHYIDETPTCVSNSTTDIEHAAPVSE